MARAGADLAERIQKALDDPVLQKAMRNAMATLYQRRTAAWSGDVDLEDLRARARALKEEAIARNDELLDLLEERVSERSGHLYRAATAADATAYIADLARARGVRTVVKSKSMTSEEVHLNAALEAAGVEVLETDLGERIIQLAGERPSHLVVPAIHKTKEDVIRLFAETMKIADPPTEAEGLTRLVREDLRARFLEAEMGVTGANFVVAETGTLVLVENEGNIRLTSQLPPIHVALVGREKIIPRLADLAVYLELLPRSGTGQLLTSYVSLITGTPSTDLLDFGGAGERPREREFHLVVLDNGRSAAARDPELREALYCIRCGACLNACAPYRLVGGHVYGGDPYPGGIGCAWTYLTQGAEEAKQTNGLCTTCARCTEVCPTKVDIPWLNTVIKERLNRKLGVGLRERVFARTDLLGRAGGALAPVANKLGGSAPAAWALERMGIDGGRQLPTYARRSLEAWFSARPEADKAAIRAAGPTPTATSSAERTAAGAPRVALFVDCFVNHNLPQVGQAAVRVFEAAGVQVVLAHNSCCGRPAVSQGILGLPRGWAVTNLEELARLIGQGCDVVCLEPSCLSMLREDYRRLLEATDLADDRRIDLIEEHSYDVSEYLLLMRSRGALHLPLAHLDDTFVVHGHCHQKSLGLGSVPVDLLRLIPGASVVEVEALCCGLVGSFGYKKEYAALSTAIGGQLFEKLTAHEGTIIASGISCRSQIQLGTGRPVLHPVEALAAALLV